MIGMMVSLAVAPGSGDDFEHAFAVLAAAVRANEPGNRLYALFRSQELPNSYTLVEIYEDEAALATHRASPHMATNRPLIEPFLVGSSAMHAFDVVSTSADAGVSAAAFQPLLPADQCRLFYQASGLGLLNAPVAHLPPRKIIMPDSPLTLISHPLCPFVQRAVIVLLEKGVSFDRINVDLSDKPDWFLALSPTGKVPVLKVGQADRPDAVLFESMVICEYLEESQGGARMYPGDALSRAQQRGWIEFGTAALADAWQFLNATDRAVADAKQAAFRDKLERLETALTDGLYFSGAAFGMVDAVYAPLFRYFDIFDPKVSQPIFEGLPRVTAWRTALAARKSVIAAVGADYAERFRQHLRLHKALLAN